MAVPKKIRSVPPYSTRVNAIGTSTQAKGASISSQVTSLAGDPGLARAANDGTWPISAVASAAAPESTRATSPDALPTAKAGRIADPSSRSDVAKAAPTSYGVRGIGAWIESRAGCGAGVLLRGLASNSNAVSAMRAAETAGHQLTRSTGGRAELSRIWNPRGSGRVAMAMAKVAMVASAAIVRSTSGCREVFACTSRARSRHASARIATPASPASAVNAVAAAGQDSSDINNAPASSNRISSQMPLQATVAKTRSVRTPSATQSTAARTVEASRLAGAPGLTRWRPARGAAAASRP